LEEYCKWRPALDVVVLEFSFNCGTVCVENWFFYLFLFVVESFFFKLTFTYCHCGEAVKFWAFLWLGGKFISLCRYVLRLSALSEMFCSWLLKLSCQECAVSSTVSKCLACLEFNLNYILRSGF